MVQPAEDMAFDATELVVSVAPFIVRRRARWSECDPAGVVHTVRFGDYVLSAADLFRNHLVGRDWHLRNRTSGFGSPAKALSLVFQGSLWPNDPFDIAVFVGDIRTRTMDLLMQASRQDGRPIFSARLSSICVATDNRTTSQLWPDDYADCYRAYAATHDIPAALAATKP